MKTPVALVAFSLAVAILLSASLLIATGARGEDSLRPMGGPLDSRSMPPPIR